MAAIPSSEAEMKRAARMVPICCSDPEVQAFIAEEMMALGPYSIPQSTKTARQLFQAARDRFGDHRCLDLLFYEH
jgi:hypothetical protein